MTVDRIACSLRVISSRLRSPYVLTKGKSSPRYARHLVFTQSLSSQLHIVHSHNRHGRSLLRVKTDRSWLVTILRDHGAHPSCEEDVDNRIINRHL